MARVSAPDIITSEVGAGERAVGGPEQIIDLIGIAERRIQILGNFSRAKDGDVPCRDDEQHAAIVRGGKQYRTFMRNAMAIQDQMGALAGLQSWQILSANLSDLVHPRARCVDDDSCSHTKFVSVYLVLQDTFRLFRLQPQLGRAGVTDNDGPPSMRVLQKGHGEPGVVGLAVVIKRGPAETVAADARFGFQRVFRLQHLVAMHIPEHRQGVVHPHSNGTIQHPKGWQIVKRKQERDRFDQPRQELHHQMTLTARFIHQTKIVGLEVPESAMDQL